MLQNISNESFIKVTVVLALVYYGWLAARYYPGEIRNWVSGRGNKAAVDKDSTSATISDNG